LDTKAVFTFATTQSASLALVPWVLSIETASQLADKKRYKIATANKP
jgi:hypothetical protein